MLKGVDLERRLNHVAALQALRATASRAYLAEAQAFRAEAEIALADRDRALDTGAAEMDALLASDVLDFDRWRIGRVVLDDLGTARDAAAHQVSRCEHEEEDARSAFGRESARKDWSGALHRKLVRKLNERRDEAVTLEAGELAVVCKMVGQS
jgi:hypothetical protein